MVSLPPQAESRPASGGAEKQSAAVRARNARRLIRFFVDFRKLSPFPDCCLPYPIVQKVHDMR